jgi:hypothetical protein
MGLEVRTAITQFTGPGTTTIRCPFCDTTKNLNQPDHPSQVWHHECIAAGHTKVWFVNGHAIKGVGKYLAEQYPAGKEKPW